MAIRALVSVRVVRETRIEGEGTPASGSTGRLEKGTGGRKDLVLLLQLCGVTRALACQIVNRRSGKA